MKKMLLFLRFVLWEYASRLARFRLCAVSSRPSSAFRPAAGPLYVRRDGRAEEGREEAAQNSEACKAGGWGYV